MSSLTTYGTLSVLTPNPTGLGGLTINNNFKSLADSLASGYVPYTGAGQDVNLGGYGISGNNWAIDDDGSGSLANSNIQWDGSGNMSVAGGLSVDGDIAPSSGKLVCVEAGLEVELFGSQYFTTDSGTMLDDGSGNMTVAGGLQIANSNFTLKGTNYSIGGEDVYGALGFYNADSNSYGFYIVDYNAGPPLGNNTLVATQNNMLDDGIGNMAVTGELAFNNEDSSGGYMVADGGGGIYAYTADGTMVHINEGLYVSGGGNIGIYDGGYFIGDGSLITNLNGGSVSSGIVGSSYGGTGVDNGSKTITLGGNLTTSGAYSLTLTLTGSASVTLPTSGTLAAVGNANTWTATQTISAANLATDTTTGMKIGTSTGQKLGFFNATPIVQPSTSISGASFTQNSGTALNSASTFGGFTIAQIAQALINLGLLA